MFVESIVWLVLNVYFEARSEPIAGQVAVAHVVINRTKIRNLSVEEVVTQSDQFSWVEKDGIVQEIESNVHLVRDILKAVKAVTIAAGQRYQGKNLDWADHYYNPKKVDPYWKEDMTPITELCNHNFLRSKRADRYIRKGGTM